MGYTVTDGVLKQSPTSNSALTVDSTFLNAIAERTSSSNRKQYALTNRAASAQMSNRNEAGTLIKKALGRLR